ETHVETKREDHDERLIDCLRLLSSSSHLPLLLYPSRIHETEAQSSRFAPKGFPGSSPSSFPSAIYRRQVSQSTCAARNSRTARLEFSDSRDSSCALRIFCS